MKQYTGTNWNSPQDSYSEVFLSQNTSQFWLPEEVPITQDLNVWRTLPSTIKDAYVKNLITLTFFDSHQGNDGMLHLQNAFDPVTHDQVKSVLSFMNMMENIHAKSYSSIFTTYLTNQETLEYFKWGEANPHLQKLMNFIIENYKELGKANAIREYGLGKPITDLEFNKIKWKAMVSSVFLETWLFYSGFYLPLWFYGQGKLMNAGEIINLIIRDESVHGLYIGLLAKELYKTFDEETQNELKEWLFRLLQEIYQTQCLLAEDIYDPIDLTHDVKVFMRYNCNKALMNLGFDPYFEEEVVNPVVLNGLNTESKSHDFFSAKGNSYQVATVEDIKDDDFNF